MTLLYDRIDASAFGYEFRRCSFALGRHDNDIRYYFPMEIFSLIMLGKWSIIRARRKVGLIVKTKIVQVIPSLWVYVCDGISTGVFLAIRYVSLPGGRDCLLLIWAGETVAVP